MSDAISSIGSKLYRGTLVVANELPNLKDISGPSFSRATIDTTSHSTPGGYKDKIVERWDGNEVTFDLNFDPANARHNDVIGDLTTSVAADDPDTYWLAFPGARGQTQWASIEFRAFLTSFDVSLPVEGVVMASVTLTVTGAPTYTANDTRFPL